MKQSAHAKGSAPRRRTAVTVLLVAVLAALVGAGVFFTFFRETREAAPNPVATITLEGIGEMKAELYPEIAPITVANFIRLANDGFYDGLYVYRVVPGVLIQTGDPVGDGTGGAGFTILGEFADNGVANDLHHTRGVLSMARQSGNDTASSQFFILQGTYPEYDGAYAAFGKVLDAQSLSVLDQAANRGVDASYSPINRLRVQSISVETYGAEYPVTRIGEKEEKKTESSGGENP